MKKGLLTLSALFLAGASFSQVVMSENFDASTSLPAGWAQYNVDGLTVYTGLASLMGSNAWVVREGATSGNNIVTSTSYYTPAGTSNDWLVSPAVAVPATGTYYAQFEAQAQDPTYPDGFKVYISTTGNTVADFGTASLTVPAATGTFSLYSVDLSAFAGQTIHVGIQNNSHDMFLLNLDNFVVRQPLPNDALLVGTSLNRYSLTSTNNTLAFSIKNDGTNAITSVDLTWNDGTDHTATVSCNITPGNTATVNHTVPVTYGTVLEKSIAVSIGMVNAATDPNLANNTGANKLFNTISATSEKNVIIEEGTGTWCGWCPRGAVGMEYMENTYPDHFIGIAVHNDDPMTVTAYDNGAGFSSFPGSNIDRVILGADASSSDFETYYNQRINVVVPASVDAVVTGSGATLGVNASVTFHTVFAASNYRLGVILSEDNVTGTTTAWDQHNYYSSTEEDLPLNGAGHNWQTSPNPVLAANMVYNHVGRALLGGYNGQAGSVPAVITDGLTASYSFSYTIPSPMNRANMHAVVVLIDNTTGEIVNAKEVEISAAGIEEASTIAMNVYPNPASSEVNVAFNGQGNYTVQLTDMSGRVISNQEVSNVNGSHLVTINTNNLTAGSYLVSIANANGSFTQNVVIK